TITASFNVTNSGNRGGAEVAQLYLTEPRRRLLGFERVELAPGETRRVTITADPRLLARFAGGQWVIAGGEYRIAAGRSAEEPVRGGVPRVGQLAAGHEADLLQHRELLLDPRAVEPALRRDRLGLVQAAPLLALHEQPRRTRRQVHAGRIDRTLDERAGALP